MISSLLRWYLCVTCVSVAVVAQEAITDVRLKPVRTAHVYKTVAGRELHAYVLNPPDWTAEDQRPAIVFFHGGGWEVGKGAPTQFNAQSEYLVTRGLVCIQIEYRLVTNNRKAAPLGACEDAKSAMRWVRNHAAKLGIDPRRIAAGGGSAGGHLAAFVGMVEGSDDPQDDRGLSCRPTAMLLYNPALLHGNQGPDDPVPAISAGLAKTYAAIAPFTSVTADDPPGIILVGTEDSVLPIRVLKEFQAKCQAAGVRMDVAIYPGEGHGFFGIRRSLARFYETTIEVDKFLGSLGWVKGEPTLTREWVKKLAAGVPPAPNKAQKSKVKAPSP